jgi:fructose/tagatose bisphosphate aldolase
MPIVSFRDLMVEAEAGNYAVGYFEAWNLESILAVADAASAMRSPVMLGFSGIYVPLIESAGAPRLRPFAALGTEVCRQLSVPACLVFNESPYADWVREAINLNFGLVMFSDPDLGPEEERERVRQVVAQAHSAGVAVEGEVKALPGVMHGVSSVPDDLHLTDAKQAREFVEFTGVDSLGVNVGQVHVHGRREIHLDFPRLTELRKEISVPLALHGGTSISPADVAEAISQGVRKINLGSILKKSYFDGMRSACARINDDYNPYEVVGSGMANDVLAAGRTALLHTAERFMGMYRSAGKA